ncbi:MAG: ComEC/Rec2 family competence protein [Candidatus Staskawiczbacteria bacterium]|nr:ComEC/Rec2 family competence protein [Candidatus Staskawiczbacteria bacterium]
MMSASKVLFFLCLSFVAGIFLESFTKIPQLFVWGILIFGVVLVCLPFLSKKIGFTAGFCILFLVLGILRMQISGFEIANDKVSQFNGKGQVVLAGPVSDEPDVRDTSQKLKVKIKNSIVLVTTKKYPEYKYLDQIKITGKLEAPVNTESFDYKNYLLKDHIYSVINFPKIELVSGKHQYNVFSYFYEKILYFKQRMSDSMHANFLPPHSLILEGIILGNNKNMTQDLRDKLNVTGLRFLTAISGVHVVILSAILISFIMFLGLGRIQAFYFSIIFIWLYIVITGFTASGIRAATMGSIFIFAGALGRQNTSSRTICLAGALMLLQNPLLLIYDIGFQLSFVACLGIIYLKPAISYLLKIIFRDKLKELLDIVSVTLTAQIFTLPLMIYNFGTISLVSPITNILILPVMPWILSFGFLFSILGAVSKFFGWIFFIPCWILMSYFLKVMDFFSQPYMAKSISNVSWIWLLLAYFTIGIITKFLNKKYSKSFL